VAMDFYRSMRKGKEEFWALGRQNNLIRHIHGNLPRYQRGFFIIISLNEKMKYKKSFITCLIYGSGIASALTKKSY
jgi:hypothetical protein